MKKFIFIGSLVIGLLFSACKTSEESLGSPTSSSNQETTSTTGDCPNGRSGAICKDGTRSTATGSGACSSHGGVQTWICK